MKYTTHPDASKRAQKMVWQGSGGSSIGAVRAPAVQAPAMPATAPAVPAASEPARPQQQAEKARAQ